MLAYLCWSMGVAAGVWALAELAWLAVRYRRRILSALVVRPLDYLARKTGRAKAREWWICRRAHNVLHCVVWRMKVPKRRHDG